MNLGIVGHAADKFTPESEARARLAIAECIARYKPDRVISGGCHLGGVDIWAEEAAVSSGLLLIVYTPQVLNWSAEGGYRDRNLRIANDSDVLVCVVVDRYPPNYRGMLFSGCYHCKARNPTHVKSGGCWTAWKAKRREWIIIPQYRQSSLAVAAAPVDGGLTSPH